MSAPAAHVDVHRSLVSLATNAHVHPSGMLKLPEDLARYEHVIAGSRPEVVVETGTRSGASARWFADHGPDVVTVDVVMCGVPAEHITWVHGDSVDLEVAAYVAWKVAGRRCMVSLDSDHSAAHVAKEIRLYGPLVSLGCYLVVEDGIFGYASPVLRAQHGLADMVGSPLNAIHHLLVDSPLWTRDVAVEDMFPITHHPAGFWVRNA